MLQSEITKNLLKRSEKDKNNGFLWPMLKSVISKIKDNKGGKQEYQGQKLKFYLSEKQYLKNHCVNIVKAIVTCYEATYSGLLSDNKNESSGIRDDENMEISDGDVALFNACCVFGSNYRKVAKITKTDHCS